MNIAERVFTFVVTITFWFIVALGGVAVACCVAQWLGWV
jgi:hypothetical protein